MLRQVLSRMPGVGKFSRPQVNSLRMVGELLTNRVLYFANLLCVDENHV